jgi:hypothetical protein
MPSTVFVLKIDNIEVGVLTYNEFNKQKESHKTWDFAYTENFKKVAGKEIGQYNLITQFKDINKVYFSHELWPFFKIRIPGLKQPALIEILEDEEIDKNDECSLLKKFGNKCISNPYILEIYES